MSRCRILAARAGAAVALLALATPASAIPAFARKYGTSCLTCHTVYPKLTPFGEAFRRNGYRFPGVDSDYVKQETIALGQEANKKTFPNSVWPASIPGSLPVAIGANGHLPIYPDKMASAPRDSNGTQFTFDNLVGEMQLWAGAALDDTITLWAEATFSSEGAAVEHAQMLFNDLVGPKHAVNLYVGRGFPNIGSFGPHSSYIADQMVPNAPVAGIYEFSGDPFVLVDNYNGVELSGVVAGRAAYNVGLNQGKNAFGSSFNSEDWYAHLGYKLGGMRLDGEGSTGAEDALHPWAENAVTLDLFAYHANEHSADPNALPVNNVSFTVGGAVRAQYGSAELDLGYYHQTHNRLSPTLDQEGNTVLGEVKADVLYGELSYVVFPWMVPALRVESISLSPTGGTSVTDWHLMPGIAFLIRPNLKIVVVGNIESCNGFPVDVDGNPLRWQGGSADWGSFVIAPRPAALPTSGQQNFESIAVLAAWAL